MRKAVEKLRIDLIPGLIEELQIYGNRMEARLDDQYDLKKLLEEKRELNDTVKKLRKKRNALEKELENYENTENN
jgi:uncharacterized protein YlxW (UPF0749 family)